ncbi:MaoC family dehydratase [Subtercola frigoramans]|uniref:Acyl dehydratase n=1 Tax=Subtercola frigoramans TaxID=120298 RepID=A0ABS2L6Z5_9MICO|nr:MaoC family dehydratase [Subtercola frigoramans]MBM7472875.1 acyl dehydratase [Subtercola frigoramans]
MRMFSSVAELEGAIGTHLGFSPWRVITQQQIDTFADATDDHQWIHVEPIKAAEGPYGSTIAHGYLTLSLVSAMLWEVYGVEGIRTAINYGADTVRFPAPVPVGSRLRAGAELRSVTRARSGFRVVVHVTVEIEGASKPACVVDSIGLLSP